MALKIRPCRSHNPHTSRLRQLVAEQSRFMSTRPRYQQLGAAAAVARISCAVQSAAFMGLSPARSPALRGFFCGRVLCNRFCGIVSVWAEVSSCFLAAHMTDLAPLRRGYFCEFSRALCNRLWYGVGGFAVIAAASPLYGTLAPLLGGAFSCGSSAQRATNFAAWRWDGGLAFWRNRQARYIVLQMDGPVATLRYPNRCRPWAEATFRCRNRDRQWTTAAADKVKGPRHSNRLCTVGAPSKKVEVIAGAHT
jgi:hypothetical protein